MQQTKWLVEAFLKDKIGFLQMSDVVEKSVAKLKFIAKPTL